MLLPNTKCKTNSKLRKSDRLPGVPLWQSQLRNLPPGVYDSIVQRILKGDALLAIAKSLHTIKPEIPTENCRKYLRMLQNNVNDVVKFQGIDTAKSATALPGTLDRLTATVTRATLDINSDQMLRYAFALQQKRVDNMVDLEERTGLMCAGGYREIITLKEIAEAVMKRETILVMVPKVTVVPEPKGEELSPIAAKIAKLGSVDRHLIQEGLRMLMAMSADERADVIAKLQEQNTESPD